MSIEGGFVKCSLHKRLIFQKRKKKKIEEHSLTSPSLSSISGIAPQFSMTEKKPLI
jgi:hypothetical protein